MLLSSVLSFEQTEDLDPQSPKYYDQFHRKVVFMEDFNSNDRNWCKRSSRGGARIHEGRFHIPTRINRDHKMYVPFDYSQNYEIEIQAKTTAKSRKGYGFFQWGVDCDIASSSIAFFRGKVILNNYTYGKWDTGARGYVEGLDEDVLHKYVIRKIDGVHYVFADGQFVVKYPAISLRGQEILLNKQKANLVVDFIKLSYLN